jgi:F-type H+-transporting ATPase subunit b
VERKKALAEVRNQVIDLTILSSSRLIQQSMQRNTAEKLVDDVIKEVGKLS